MPESKNENENENTDIVTKLYDAFQGNLPHYHVITTDNGNGWRTFTPPFSWDMARGYASGLIASKPTRRKRDVKAIWLIDGWNDCPLCEGIGTDIETDYLQQVIHGLKPLWEQIAS